VLDNNSGFQKFDSLEVVELLKFL